MLGRIKVIITFLIELNEVYSKYKIQLYKNGLQYYLPYFSYHSLVFSILKIRNYVNSSKILMMKPEREQNISDLNELFQ